MSKKRSDNQREAIPKSVRVQVLERDHFRFVYCGQSPAVDNDVLLEVDHIHPVAKGGDNDPLNLQTLCWDCNAGKSDKTPGEIAKVRGSYKEAEAQQEKREQLEQIAEWYQRLRDNDRNAARTAVEHFSFYAGSASDYSPREQDLIKHIRQFGIDEVMTAIDIAGTQYVVTNATGEVVPESVVEARHKLAGILYTRKIERRDPNQAALSHLYNTLNKRFHSVDRKRFFAVGKQVMHLGLSQNDIFSILYQSEDWNAFIKQLDNELVRLEQEQQKISQASSGSVAHERDYFDANDRIAVYNEALIGDGFGGPDLNRLDASLDFLAPVIAEWAAELPLTLDGMPPAANEILSAFVKSDNFRTYQSPSRQKALRDIQSHSGSVMRINVLNAPDVCCDGPWIMFYYSDNGLSYVPMPAGLPYEDVIWGLMTFSANEPSLLSPGDWIAQHLDKDDTEHYPNIQALFRPNQLERGYVLGCIERYISFTIFGLTKESHVDRERAEQAGHSRHAIDALLRVFDPYEVLHVLCDNADLVKMGADEPYYYVYETFPSMVSHLAMLGCRPRSTAYTDVRNNDALQAHLGDTGPLPAMLPDQTGLLHYGVFADRAVMETTREQIRDRLWQDADTIMNQACLQR